MCDKFENELKALLQTKDEIINRLKTEKARDLLRTMQCTTVEIVEIMQKLDPELCKVYAIHIANIN